MAGTVDVSVQTQLKKIADDLNSISKKMEQTEKGFKTTATAVDNAVEGTMDKTRTGVASIAGAMTRILKGLKEDFKSLASIAALSGAMKLSSTMKNTVTGAVTLSDTVRKLSGIFKIANKDQASFVGNLTKGLGAVGLGADSAVNSLEGLAETQVRGQENLTRYATTAGMLAAASKEGGQEGQIAKGLAGVVQAQGKNVNSPEAMAIVADAVIRAREATGKGATEILSNMQELFSSMNDTFKKQMTPQGAAGLTAISAAGGKGGTDFIADYLSKNSHSRAGLDALGFGQLFSAQGGLNQAALKGIIGKGKSMGLNGDVISGLTGGMGLSEDQAKGLKMLYDQLEAVNKAAAEVAQSTRHVADAYEDSKTLGEAFRGNFDKLKGAFGKTIASGTGALTDIFKETQKTTGGAAAVAGGSALAAAALARAGLGGIGSAFGIKGAQEQALEAQGEKIIPVRVVNASEIGSGGTGGGGLLGNSKVGQTVEKLGKATVVAGAIYETSKVAGNTLYENSDTYKRFIDTLADGLTSALKSMGMGSGRMTGPQIPPKLDVKVSLHDRNKELKPVQGGSTGPRSSGVNH